MAKGGNTPAARLAAAEHQRQVVLLRIRGVAFEAIGKQLGMSRVAAFKLYKRALKATPKADVEEMRKLEGERIADLRQRIWTRLAGRPDPNDPTKMIPPDNEEFVALANQAVRLARHEAMVFGLDEPSKAQVLQSFSGGLLSEEEIERQWGRLTAAEQETFLMLLQKLQGRWVEPPSIETTAAPVAPSSN